MIKIKPIFHFFIIAIEPDKEEEEESKIGQQKGYCSRCQTRNPARLK